MGETVRLPVCATSRTTPQNDTEKSAMTRNGKNHVRKQSIEYIIQPASKVEPDGKRQRQIAQDGRE